jgi:hypothetical protein
VSESKINSKEKLSKRLFVERVRENPWMISTFVLGILFVGFLFSGSGFTGNVIDERNAEGIFLNYLESAGADIDLVEVTDISLENNLYQIQFNYEGKAYPVAYSITRDGSLIGMMSPVKVEEVKTEVPKTDKPVVELFVWGYCPYGVQAQGPLAEVASILSNYADIKAVMYYDGHGAFETQQNKIQECMQEIAPEKYWSYADGFVENIYPKCSITKDVECDKTESVNLMESLGIDSEAVLECVDSKGEGLIADASSYAKKLGVTGSPTLVVNGVKVNVARTADAFQTAICSGFTEDNIPEECFLELDSTTATASGSC